MSRPLQRHRPKPVADSTQTKPVAVFKTHSDLVELHVNVFDGRSDAVADLPQSAFQVLEDGVVQKIEFFNARDVPVAIGLVIDNSSSMITRRPMVKAGISAFAESSHAADEMFTIVFNERIRYGLPPEMPFTQDPRLLQSSLDRHRTGGMTALHDAVIEGLGHLEEATNQKHVLLVLSDGDDNASRHSRQNMLYRAAQSSAIVYTIWTGDETSRGNPRVLSQLAKGSGGLAYMPKSEQDLVKAFGTVAANIRRGYTIGYAPTNTSADGTYRRVKVAVRAPGKKLNVRVRDGYAAADDHDQAGR